MQGSPWSGPTSPVDQLLEAGQASIRGGCQRSIGQEDDPLLDVHPRRVQRGVRLLVQRVRLHLGCSHICEVCSTKFVVQGRRPHGCLPGHCSPPPTLSAPAAHPRGSMLWLSARLLNPPGVWAEVF